MEILDSLEVRWFLPDGHPAKVGLNTWFGSIPPEGKRVDDYLRTGLDELGFKARAVENEPVKVEAKYLIGSLGTVRVAPGITGRLERWRKLSLALDDQRLKQDGSWLGVEKVRRLRKFAYDRGKATEVAASDHPDAGCGVELTQLGFTREKKRVVEWTFGLEAFGPKHELLEVFLATSVVAFASRLELELDGQWSNSYPAWLRSVRD